MSKNVTGGLNDDGSLEPMHVGVEGLDVDIHRGAHDFPDITAQIPDTDGLQQFGVRFEDAVKHMSVHKYESEASMIREYVANMAATCLEAREKLDEDYSPVIHIAYYPSSKTLIMEDNGMGMSSEEIESVGIQLGVSTNRYNSDRGGKYGIGLLSGLKGVGLDGAFFMHSRSRRTDEYVRGLWSAYGFKDVEELPDKLEDGQYGTRFEFPLKEPEVDIRSAIAEVAQWSRIPVLYTERNSDGSLIADDEYGGRSDTPFQDRYSESEGDIVIETDAFRAVHSPNASGQAVLLDVPIERNFDSDNLNAGSRDLKYELPYGARFDAVFNSEDQEIVDGPHEGLTRVGDGEYAEMPEDRREGYIPASDCAPSDIWTPSPAGDRDRFEENPDFWRWLAKQFLDRFDEKLERVITDAVATEQILALPREDIDFIVRWMDHETFNDDWQARKLKSNLEDHGLEDVDDETLGDFAQMSNTVEHCKRGRDPWSSASRVNTRIYEVLLSTPEDAEVWMAQHPSEKKAQVVWDDHDGHTVVRVQKQVQDRYEELFNWRRLNYVGRDTLDEFDVSEETRERFERNYNYENPNAGADAPERVITLHYARNTDDNDRGYMDTTEKESARYLRAYLEARGAGYTPDRGLLNGAINQLILFPSNCDETMSDYLGVLGHGGVRLANCAVKSWDYLKDLDRVYRIEDYLEEAHQLEVPTSAGEMTLPEAREAGESVVVHLLGDDPLRGLRDTPEMSEAATWFEEERGTSWRSSDPEELGDVVYVPVGQDTLEQLLPELRHEGVWLATHEYQYPLPESSRLTSADRDTEVYAYANLHNWRDTTEYEILSEHRKGLQEGMLGVIDGFAELHDAGVTVPSQRESVEGETYTTMLEVLQE
jgi:hypothetical protein